MKIVTLSSNQFNEFAKKHRYRSYFQTVKYGKLMKLDGYEYHLLGFVNNSNELIGASMVLFKKLFLKYKVAYAPYGFLVDYTNSDLIEEMTNKLKKLLYKQNFLYIKINPRIECSRRNKDGQILAYNPEINNIMEILQKNGYLHHGFNNYFENMKPRWNAVLKLTASNEKLYKNFSKQIRNKISKAEKYGVVVSESNDIENVEEFYEFIKRKHNRDLKYYQKLVKEFDGSAKIYFTELDTRKYLENSQDMYEKEMDRNELINDKLQQLSKTSNNINKIMNQKMESDVAVEKAHEHLVKATKLYNRHPNNIKIGGILVIENEDGADLIIEGYNEKYKDLDPNYLLKWELIKKYNLDSKKYFNLNGIVGDFDSQNKYSGLNESKLGYNAEAIEYIGEFDYIINKTIYNLYKRKKDKKDNKKDKKKTSKK